MKKRKTTKYKRQHKKELANRKAKQEQKTKFPEVTVTAPMSPARRAFEGL